MTEIAMDGGFWRGFCFTERFDPPFCRPLIAAGGRCRSSPGSGRGVILDALPVGFPSGRYRLFLFVGPFLIEQSKHFLFGVYRAFHIFDRFPGSFPRGQLCRRV